VLGQTTEIPAGVGVCPGNGGTRNWRKSECEGLRHDRRVLHAVVRYTEACEAYCLAAAIIFRSMTFLAASIAGSSVSRRVGVPFSLRNCWMNESS
jgi:hypothetical protein